MIIIIPQERSKVKKINSFIHLSADLTDTYFFYHFMGFYN